MATKKKARAKKVTRLVIVRRRWGTGDEGGYLHNPETHKQCCLGFFARACGVSLAAIKEIGMPHEVSEALGKMPPWCMRKERASDVGRLSEINDEFCTDEKWREDRIARIFAKHGVRVVFK